MNIQELRAKSLKIAHEARELLNTINDTNEAEVQAQFDRMIGESDSLAARAATLEKIEARETEFNAADARRPNGDAEARVGEFTAETRAATIEKYLRGEATAAELRAQSVGTDSEGGYLVPTETMTNLILSMKAFGPMNEGGPCTYYNTKSGNPLELPTLDDTSGVGAALAENTAASDVALAFGIKTLGAYKVTSGIFKVSSELLTDSALPIADIVYNAVTERIGRKINAWLTTGTGSSQPSGIVTGAAAGKTAASATAIAADELLDLIHSVDPAYRGKGAFMAHDSVLLAVRKLKDSNGQYIWQPSNQVGMADRLFGYQILVNQGMASTIAASAKTVLFGDFSKYVARKAGGLVVKRLNERFAEADQVGFVGFARVDGVVSDAAAIKVLTQAVS